MIDPTQDPAFPVNVIACLSVVLSAVDEDAVVIKRPLRSSDPNYSIGVFASNWMPEEDSYEFRGVGSTGPTLERYSVGIQTLIKDGDTERALATASIFNKRIRRVLYRNAQLRNALAMLYVQDGATRESFRGSGLSSQRFMSNEIEGSFVFISVSEYWIETEIS